MCCPSGVFSPHTVQTKTGPAEAGGLTAPQDQVGEREVVGNGAGGPSHICWVLLLCPRTWGTEHFTGLSQPQPHQVLAVTPPHQQRKGTGALWGEVTARVTDRKARQRQALNPGCPPPEFMALRMKRPLGFWVFPLLSPVPTGWAACFSRASASGSLCYSSHPYDPRVCTTLCKEFCHHTHCKWFQIPWESRFAFSFMESIIKCHHPQPWQRWS